MPNKVVDGLQRANRARRSGLLRAMGVAAILLVLTTSAVWLLGEVMGSQAVDLQAGLNRGLWFGALLVVVIQLCHLTGLWEWPGWSSRQPAIAVLLGAAILQTLLVERHTTLERLERHLAASELESLDRFRERLDPTMDRIFGDEVQFTSRMLRTAVTERRVDLGDDIDLFKRHYRKTLAAYPKSHLFATSLPSKRYFWTDDALRMMDSFIQGGGTVSRVFFVAENDLAEHEPRAIMRRHCEMGVEVYVTDTSSVSGSLVQYFLFDEGRQFGWEVRTDSRGVIKNTIATTNPAVIEEYARMWTEIMSSPATVPLPTVEPDCRLRSDAVRE